MNRSENRKMTKRRVWWLCKKNDYKLDLRPSKTMPVGKVRLQGIVEGFNILNTKNLSNFNGVFGALTYLQPASSTEIFYQPRQAQIGFRVSY
jgi:hypothetical protein